MKEAEWAKNRACCVLNVWKASKHSDFTSAVTFFLDEFLLCGGMKIVCWAVRQSWWMEDRLGGPIRSVTTAMPSCWWFEEDTWEQHARTMSWGVTLTWDEALFIPHALLLFLFPVSLLSASHDSALSDPELIYCPQAHLSQPVILSVVECN